MKEYNFEVEDVIVDSTTTLEGTEIVKYSKKKADITLNNGIDWSVKSTNGVEGEE